MTHWYQRLLIHTRLTEKSECETYVHLLHRSPKLTAILTFTVNHKLLSLQVKPEPILNFAWFLLYRYNKLAREWTQKYAM